MDLSRRDYQIQQEELFQKYKNVFEKPQLPIPRKMITYGDYEDRCAEILNSVGLTIDNRTMIDEQVGPEFMCNVAKVQLSIRQDKIPLHALQDFYLDSIQFLKPMNIYISPSGYDYDTIQYAYQTNLILLQMTNDGRVGGVTKSGMMLLLMGTRAMMWGHTYGPELQYRIFRHMYPSV